MFGDSECHAIVKNVLFILVVFFSFGKHSERITFPSPRLAVTHSCGRYPFILQRKVFTPRYLFLIVDFPLN